MHVIIVYEIFTIIYDVDRLRESFHFPVCGDDSPASVSSWPDGGSNAPVNPKTLKEVEVSETQTNQLV